MDAVVARVERERPLVRPLGLSKPPLGDERQPTGNVSRGQAWLQLQGCVRPREDILDRKVCPIVEVQQGVTFGDPGVGVREARIERDGLGEQAPAELAGALVLPARELPAAEVEMVGLHILGRRPADRLLLTGQQPDPERRDDAARDLVLCRKHVSERPVVALGPQMPAGGYVDQLRRDPDPVAGPADATLQDERTPSRPPASRTSIAVPLRAKAEWRAATNRPET